MTIITQFGGSQYDTADYPLIMCNPYKSKVYCRCSTLEKARKCLKSHLKNNPDDIVLLFDDSDKTFIDWTTGKKSGSVRAEDI